MGSSAQVAGRMVRTGSWPYGMGSSGSWPYGMGSSAQVAGRMVWAAQHRYGQLSTCMGSWPYGGTIWYRADPTMLPTDTMLTLPCYQMIPC